MTEVTYCPMSVATKLYFNPKNRYKHFLCYNIKSKCEELIAEQHSVTSPFAQHIIPSERLICVLCFERLIRGVAKFHIIKLLTCTTCIVWFTKWVIGDFCCFFHFIEVNFSEGLTPLPDHASKSYVICMLCKQSMFAIYYVLLVDVLFANYITTNSYIMILSHI